MIIKKYIKNFINLIKKKEKIPVYTVVDSSNGTLIDFSMIDTNTDG